MGMSLRVRLGEILRAQRQRLALTRAEVAKRARLSTKYLSEIEQGKANASISALERLTAALEWDPVRLFATNAPPLSHEMRTSLSAKVQELRSHVDDLGQYVHSNGLAVIAERPSVDAEHLGSEAGGQWDGQEKTR